MSSRFPAVSLVVIGAVGRLMPHPWNFTPVDAIGLYGGARLSGWFAYLLPALVMMVTDPIISTMHGSRLFSWGRLLVYASLTLNVLIGRWLMSRRSPIRIGAAASAAASQFFLITNFGVWLGSSMYPPTAAGLAACYLAALPFFGRTLAGALFYSALLFGVEALAARSWLKHPVTSRP